jgi:hypothetical protein
MPDAKRTFCAGKCYIFHLHPAGTVFPLHPLRLGSENIGTLLKAYFYISEVCLEYALLLLCFCIEN